MSIEVHGRIVETDEEGFLIDPDEWDEDVGDALIKQHEADGHIPVSETARGMVGYFREHYRESKAHPTLNKLRLILTERHGKGFHDQEAYKKFLYGLFPHGPVRMLCKLAGIPKPTDELE
jgi:TusE/DsrC/DsvC family sulfur relay protein